jgi:dihydrofolate synthase / folylpolyglutamate synthase
VNKQILPAKQNLLGRIYSLPRSAAGKAQADLDFMRQLMAELGNPQKQYKALHVAGTNGKGSVSAMLSSVLTTARKRTGLFTSPHLVDFNERIQVDGRLISDEELLRLSERVDAAAALLPRTPRFFEYVTALALLHFSEQRVEVAVLETGMGGGRDPTSIVEPDVAVITNVSLDHERLIGPGLPQIAAEKAGIIKRGARVVTAEQHEPSLAIIRQAAKAANAELMIVHEHCKLSYYEGTVAGQEFTVEGSVNGTFSLPLLGQHQVVNALTALLALKAYCASSGQTISDDAIKQGLESTHWPGRLQPVSMHPLVLLDGAHNEAGIAALHTYLESVRRDVVVVLGLSEGRAPQPFAEHLSALARKIIITEASYNSQRAEQIAASFTALGVEASVVRSAAKAYDNALEELGEKELLLVTGSLYLVGDVLKHLEEAQKQA